LSLEQGQMKTTNFSSKNVDQGEYTGGLGKI
jgi:hypothetical protein